MTPDADFALEKLLFVFLDHITDHLPDLDQYLLFDVASFLFLTLLVNIIFNPSTIRES